jgi:hypothetical protein
MEDHPAMKTIYGLFDLNLDGGSDSAKAGWRFGPTPYEMSRQGEYDNLSKKVDLKQDFGWREVSHQQNILMKCAVWDSFPSEDHVLLNYEFQAGNQDQQIDLLYLDSTGKVTPCELKIGGSSRDAHGQLIRYIADLHDQTIDGKWIHARHSAFLSRIKSEMIRRLQKEAFDNFLTKHGIADPNISLAEKSGFIIDDQPPAQMRKAVSFLNRECGFSIKIYQMDAYVHDNWTQGSDDFIFKVEIQEITP